MRRRSLLALVGIVIHLYVAVFAWELSKGHVEVTELMYVLVTPSLVVGGVILLLRRPGHPIGELLVLSGMAAFVVPAIIEALTVEAFAIGPGPMVDVGRHLVEPDGGQCRPRARHHPGGAVAGRPNSVPT